MSQMFNGMLFNFLIFFFLASLYNQINTRNISLIKKNCLTGVIFGAIACLGMVIGIELQPGLKIDGRVLIVGVSAAYGGPISGIISALIVSVFRAYIGGLGVYVGIAGIFGAFLTGYFFHKKTVLKPVPYGWRTLGFLGLALTLQAQLFVPLFFPLDVALNLLKKVFFVGILFYPFSVIFIGLLLNSGIRKNNLRDELEKSYHNIELKVQSRTFELEAANRKLNNTIEEKQIVENELRKAIKEIETLSGILPICSHCKDIRNDEGSWVKIEYYIKSKSTAQFSHSICEKCFTKYYPEEAEEDLS